MQSPPFEHAETFDVDVQRENAQPLARVAGTRQRNAWILAISPLLALRSRYDVSAPPGAFTSVILWAVAFAAWLLFGWWTAQPDPQFVVYGLPASAWYVLGALLIASIIARSSRPPVEFGRALATVLGKRTSLRRIRSNPQVRDRAEARDHDDERAAHGARRYLNTSSRTEPSRRFSTAR